MLAEIQVRLEWLAGRGAVAEAATGGWDGRTSKLAGQLGCGDPEQPRVARRPLSKTHDRLSETKAADPERSVQHLRSGGRRGWRTYCRMTQPQRLSCAPRRRRSVPVQPIGVMSGV
jgi:hypothetical protein